jgi:hypothetical protein
MESDSTAVILVLVVYYFIRVYLYGEGVAQAAGQKIPAALRDQAFMSGIRRRLGIALLLFDRHQGGMVRR